MNKATTRNTIERGFGYRLYFSDDRFYVDYYNGGIIHSYATEAAAREAIYYHFY